MGLVRFLLVEFSQPELFHKNDRLVGEPRHHQPSFLFCVFFQ